jgi:NlpC/P60 family
MQSLDDRNHRFGPDWHQNGTMRNLGKPAMTALLCGLAFCAWAQQPARPAETAGTIRQDANLNRAKKNERALSSDDRLAVIASALDSRTPRYSEHDCSHLVHAIYERAGFPYPYADSDDLYDGVEGFQRVSRPQTGDLVVWRGHAGIVIRPSRHVFFSFLHAGPGIDDYNSKYWSGRGQPRFYRYIKNDRCAGCTLARGRGE